jgi:beta-galactosidase
MQRRDYPGALSNSLIGYFQTFANHNIPVDFIHREHLENRDLSQYKLVIIPYPIMFTEKAAAGVREFVNNGGYVLAEARLAWNDDRGYASEIIPGLGLHEVFGVREDEVRMRESLTLYINGGTHPALKGLKTGDLLKGSLYSQSVKPLGSSAIEVLAVTSGGQPAVVSTRHGKGEAMLAGTYLGMANFPDVDPVNDLFFINLLNWAKIERPFTTTVDGRTSSQVEVRLQENKKGYLLFIINHSEKREEIEIDLKIRTNGNYIIRDVINETVSRQRGSGNILQIKAGIDRKQVFVYEITPDS